MIGVLIKYKDKTMFAGLPKDSESLENQLLRIGLNVPLQAINLSNHNDIGYELEIYAQSQIDMEVASRIILHDNIGQLNDLMAYIAKNDSGDMYEIISNSYSESISELYDELTAPHEIETADKLIIKTCLNHKATYYEPSECVVEKVIPLPTEDFQELLDAPLNSYDFITENRMCMYCDENEVNHCLLVYDKDSGDGLLINAEGYDHARYSAYIPHAKELLEKHDLEQSGFKTVKAPITESEKRLLDIISNAADRIATFVHLGYKDFCLEDTLRDQGCDFDDIKDMILHAVAQKIGERDDIASVKVNDLDIPLQPEITVTATEEIENMTAEAEELGSLSF